MRLGFHWLAAFLLLACGWADAAWAEGKNWYETVKVNGDLRYRFESIQEENAADRDRQSIRARLGLEAAPTEGWKAAFRLATGASNPISTEQTLGDNFTRKPIGLDLAYLEYAGFPLKAALTAGKMANPFIMVGKSQLIWDVDLNPEGVAGKIEQGIIDNLAWFVRGGGFWIQEKSAGLDPMLYGAQTGALWSMADVQVTAGFGYFYFTEITKQYAFDYSASNTATAKSYGNSLTHGKYANNYVLGEGFVEASFKLLDLPLKAYVDYVLNNGATHFNRGYLVGVNVNRAKEAGTWEGGYTFRWLEKDAVVAAFCDSTFLGGGTDGTGHSLYFAYAIANQAKASLTYFLCGKNMEDPKYYRRLQVDLTLAY